MHAHASSLILIVPKPELGYTYFTVGDAFCCRFEAETVDDVRDANDVAGVPFARVVAAEEIVIGRSEPAKKGNLS